ncbi:MAG: recombination mediator RecR, partial [Spirochaetota bacterium]
MTTLDLLIKNLSMLPGIGKKSAARIAYFLLKKDHAFLEGLSQQILHLKEKIRPCIICGNYTEMETCEICSDGRRDKSIICVVEHPQDVHTLESTREFEGLFHVLGGVLSPIDGIGPEELNIKKLIDRVRNENIKELIIATNPTVEGDTTALYLVKVLKDPKVKITRLASGLPVGGDLEYADRLTLARSLKGRMPFRL